MVATVALALGTARCAPSERTRPPEASAEASARSREALGSLGYLARVDASDSLDKRGVTTVDPERSAEGSNLFSSLDSHRALLVDRDGTTLHQWSAQVGPTDRWQLLALVEESRLMALDRESRPLWTLDAPVHHDVAPPAVG